MQPEGHVHLTVQLDSGRQFGTGLLPPADPGIQGAKAEVTVGLERAHAKFVGQGEGLAVVVFGLIALRGLAPRRDLAEEAQGICLVCRVPGGRGQSASARSARVCASSRRPASSWASLEGETTERLIAVRISWCGGLFHRLGQQWHGVGDAPAQGIRRTQGRSYPGEPGGEVRVLTDAHGLFEQGEGPGQVALSEGQQTKPVIGTHQAPGVRHRLGNPQRFFPEGMPSANMPSSAWHTAR